MSERTSDINTAIMFLSPVSVSSTCLFIAQLSSLCSPDSFGLFLFTLTFLFSSYSPPSLDI